MKMAGLMNTPKMDALDEQIGREFAALQAKQKADALYAAEMNPDNIAMQDMSADMLGIGLVGGAVAKRTVPAIGRGLGIVGKQADNMQGLIKMDYPAFNPAGNTVLPKYNNIPATAVARRAKEAEVQYAMDLKNAQAITARNNAIQKAKSQQIAKDTLLNIGK